MSRTVTLVLVGPDGRPLGALAPFPVELPWWQEVGEIDDRFQVLRLLHGDRPAPPGGHVTYLAQTASPPAGLRPAEVDLAPHPRRAAYAEIGGPGATLAWAESVLERPIVARQQRTWNLSAIWRLDGGPQPVWLKQVPAFFAHEPHAIRIVDAVVPGLTPTLIADGPDGRMLMAHAPGEDGYGAGEEVRARIAEAFHPVQAGLAGADLPIPRVHADAEQYSRLAAPHYGTIDGLERLIDGLPERFAAIEECGLPDTLVHGDLHPGNVRVGDRLTIMDWGDCHIGHPAFDILRLTGDVDRPGALLDAWAARWRRSVPGSDPLRAAELMRPVAALRSAAVYAAFVAAIEPSEWPYHASDVPAALAAAASIVGE